MDGIDTFESPLLQDVQINPDGTLKQSGKQNVKFYREKQLAFRALPLYVMQDDGTPALDSKGRPIQAKDEKGKLLFDIDPRTGLPKKEPYEKIVEKVRVETKGDTNIKDDIADAFSKRQFFRQYKYFMSGKIPDGQPIDDCSWLQPQTVTELHMYGVHTVEQIAEMEDIDCEQIKDQSGYEIRDIARQWIKITSPSGQAGRADRLALEVERLKSENAELRSQGRKRKRLVESVEAIEGGDPAPEVTEATMEIPTEDLKTRRRKV